MVSCKLVGRMGNQMFQIACAIGFAKKHGMSFHIPIVTENMNIWPPAFTHLQNPLWNDKITFYDLYETIFNYSELKLRAGINDYMIWGYRQSEKYFADARQEVLEAFKIPYSYKTGWTAIHYRCGDYKHYPNSHPIITEEYLERAINHASKSGYEKFLVFSDELGVIKKILNKPQFRYSSYQFVFSENKSPIEDLAAMSGCQNQICSNSSFSWWASYLNQYSDKMVIMPKAWFGPELPHDTSDIYLSNSIIL